MNIVEQIAEFTVNTYRLIDQLRAEIARRDQIISELQKKIEKKEE